jgi:DNA-binding NarL/FixJ family response regulator
MAVFRHGIGNRDLSFVNAGRDVPVPLAGLVVLLAIFVEGIVMRVLIVDDSHTARLLLAQAVNSTRGLELAGEADFAAHAVEQFRRLRPDLVVLDAQLPDGYGVEVLRVIKQEAPHCVVAMISNYPLLFENASLKEGADYFIAKLSGLDNVKNLLHRIADKHGTTVNAHLMAASC